jgi:hypothetical protein
VVSVKKADRKEERREREERTDKSRSIEKG